MGQTPADGTSRADRDPQAPFAVSQAFVEPDPSTEETAPVSEQQTPEQDRSALLAADQPCTGPAEIATLPPLEQSHPAGLPISASTGQPRRAKWMVVADVLLYAASLVSAVALARSWWLAMHMDSFMTSSHLVELWQPRPGGWRSIVAVTLVALLGAALVAAPAIAALNAWNGHRWSRTAALLAAVLGLAGWLISPWAWPAPVLSLLGALVLFLPPVTRYFGHWKTFRAGTPVPVRERHEVVYGPLPRYL
ncbi:hypothetical protein [Luteococcus peritonei]|uniref:Uncharacterized protein n=1 Tax=Luteococcus peritonei TaxID=88874 RepID=A0ABW4RSG9_9ACTN